MKPIGWLLTSPSGGTHVTTSQAVFENAVAWGWTSIALGDVHAERAKFEEALAEVDRIMGHDDEATEWREKWAHLYE